MGQKHFQSRGIPHNPSLGSAAPELWTLATREPVACDRASLQEHRQETETSSSFLRRTTGIQEPSEEAWISSVLNGYIQVFQMLVGRRNKEENHEL